MKMASNIYWWQRLGFPAFAPWELNRELPDPGEVIKYYRKQKVVTGSDGKTHSCWQSDLANMLGITESWVRAMEKNGKGLDSFSRRQALIAALGIPPMLLGLSTTGENLLKELGGILPVADTTLAILRDSLHESWQLYYAGTVDIQLSVTNKIKALDVFLEEPGNQGAAHQLRALQTQFYLLNARVDVDQTDYKSAHENLTNATKIAEKLDNKELLAACYFWRGRAYLEQEEFPASKAALGKALGYAQEKKNDQIRTLVPASLYGAILLESGLAHAYVDGKNPTLQQKFETLEFFAKAKKYTGNVGDDPYQTKFNLGRYYYFKAEAMIVMGSPEEALESLEKADQHTPASLLRRKAYINILRAQAALDMEDYTYAAHTALDAADACKTINSSVNLDFLKKINAQLQASPLANSEPVTRLNLALLNV